MSNGLADRFKRGDESVMDMMKRIKKKKLQPMQQPTNGNQN